MRRARQEADAQRLRNMLLARAAGVRYDTEEAPEAPEREVLTVPVERLLASLVRSGTTVGLVLLVLALAVALGAFRQVAVLPALVPGPGAATMDAAPGSAGPRFRTLGAHGRRAVLAVLIVGVAGLAIGQVGRGAPPPTVPAPADAGAPALIGIEDFAKLDLRIGRVLECGFVEGSDKLLRFKLDAGKLGERQIFSGIRASYGEPEKLVGRHVVFIANLAPRKMRFGTSEGMILSAGFDDGALALLDVDSGALPGMPVR